MRTFDTGATRDSNDNKPSFRGFLSAPAIRRFGEYMHKHRLQADGSLRSADNWKKGMPAQEYVESGWRHWVDVWEAFDEGRYTECEEAACAMYFNVQGLLHELLKRRGY